MTNSMKEIIDIQDFIASPEAIEQVKKAVKECPHTSWKMKDIEKMVSDFNFFEEKWLEGDTGFVEGNVKKWITKSNRWHSWRECLRGQDWISWSGVKFDENDKSNPYLIVELGNNRVIYFYEPLAKFTRQGVFSQDGGLR